MQPNKTKISLILGALYLGVSGTSMAASESFNITATTIADVILTEETALDFGANIFTTAGTCSMDAEAPASADLQLDIASAIPASDYGKLTGTACIEDAVATPGVYKITGTEGADVNITLGSISTAEFTFVPDSNAYGEYDGGADADSIGTNLSTSGVNSSITLAASGDAGSNAEEGELLFTLGGTLSILTDLTASTVYNAETFLVTVTY